MTKLFYMFYNISCIFFPKTFAKTHFLAHFSNETVLFCSPHFTAPNHTFHPKYTKFTPK